MNMTDLHTLSHRSNLGAFLNRHGLCGAGVEVGVAFGENAASILREWKGTTLHLVDLWAEQPAEEYREITGGDFLQRLASAKALATLDPRARLHQMDSLSASRLFSDSSLDFAYIDANHGYEAVMADLEAWWPRVRNGGLFGGHDFYTDIQPPAFVQVQQAVSEWCSQKGLEYILTGCTSWWTIKPA
jgi:methyltransferase family protein